VRWPFWDGRVDSLWAQALGPIENPREMRSSRLFVAHRVASMHRAAYEAVFGVMPDLSDAARFPSAGGPGDAAWEAMSAADRDVVTRVLVNVGKAVEAYERTLAPPHTRFDDYLAGNVDALTTIERDGLREYVREGCADCHYGPAMSDSAFHAIGMPGVGTDATLDVGRAAAFAPLSSSTFRRQGAFSDDTSAADPLAGLTGFDEAMIGAFRTPTLRALRASGPYGHAGTFTIVRDVVVHYARIRMPHAADPHVAGSLDAHLVGFDDIASRVDPLTAFLMTL
jgi:cytochrome c peroxidase